MPELEAHVVDPETSTERPIGEPGELWFRGPLLMEGYYGRERWTTFTADEWYRTGDLFLATRTACFYFLGRRDDMIKTAGANVSPREVEAVLRDVTGGLARDRVRSPRRGTRLDRRRGHRRRHRRSLDPDALHDALRARLSAYKVPRKIVALAPASSPCCRAASPTCADWSRVVM